MADGVVIFDVELDSSGLSGQLGGLGSKLAKGAAVAAAGAAVGKGFSAAIGAGMNFESIMSKVKALSDATDSQMADLTQSAKDWGASTAFSASEVGQAFTYMAQAGWDTSSMLAGIGPILNLAAADGLDLATTSDIVTDSLTAFGLTAGDTAMYADVLATAAAASNTNVHMMGETFKYAAPVAGALGYSVQDVALAVGLMANAGIKGSQAGTALRGVLTRMAKPTKQSQQAMDALGVSLSNVDGTMKPFGQVLGELREGFAGMTAEQQASYAAMLAGQEGMSGLLAIVNASEEEYNNLADAIANSEGSAERMAKTMMDNLAGDVEEFKGAAETLALEFYETFSDSLRKAVQTGTSIIDKLTGGIKKGDLSGALSSIFSEDVPAISKMIGEKIGEAIGQLPDLIKDTSDVNSALLKGLASGGKAMAEGIITGIGDNLPTLLPDIATQIVTGLGKAFETLPEFVQAATSIVDGLKNALLGSETDGVDSAISEQMASLGKSLVTSLSAAISQLPDLAVSVGEIIGAIAKALGEGVAGLIEGVDGNQVAKSLGEFAGALVSGIAAALPGIVEGFDAIVGALMDGITSALTIVKTGEQDGAITTFAKTLLENLAKALKLDEEQSQTLNTAFSEIISSLSVFEENAASFASDSLTVITDALTALSTWCTENKAVVTAALGALATTLLILNAPLVLTAGAVALVIANWNGLKAAATELATTLEESLTKAGKALKDFYDKMMVLFSGDFSGENPFPEGSFLGNYFSEGKFIMENQKQMSWGDLFALIFPSAGAEGETLPPDAQANIEQYASGLSQEAQLALVEAFKNGEISADVLEALVFGSSDGTIPQDQLAAIVGQISTLGPELQRELIASLTGSGGEGGEEGEGKSFLQSLLDGLFGGEEQTAALTQQMTTIGAQMKAALIAGFNGGGEAGAEGGVGAEGGAATDEMTTLGTQLAHAVATGISTGSGNISSEMKSAIDSAKNAVNIQAFVNLGLQISQGVARGIKQGSGAIALALIAAIKNALAEGLAAAEIHSPSRLFRDELGRWIPAGAAEGIEMNAWQMREATRQMVLDSVPSLNGFGRRVAAGMDFGFVNSRLAHKAYMAGFEPVQEINFNVPVQTPDEFAQTVELFMTYGLEADF